MENWKCAKTHKRIAADLKVMRGVALLLVALIALSGCGVLGGLVNETQNLGGAATRGPQVTVTAPADMFSMETSNWTASWSGGEYPYTITWDFGGGAENIPASPAISPASATVIPNAIADSTFTFTVVVTDAQGLAGSATGTYSIGMTRNAMPTVTASVEGGEVTVMVSDSDTDDVTVSVTDIPGMTVDSNYKVADSSGIAIFYFETIPPYAETQGTTYITADDGNGGTSTTSATVFPNPPEDYVFLAEYNREFKIITLNMDFSESDLVRVGFIGLPWVAVDDGSWQDRRGGWTTKKFLLSFSEDEMNSGTMRIRAEAYFDSFESYDPTKDYPVYEASVFIERPIYISNSAYDFFNEVLSVEIDVVESASVYLSTDFPNGIQATDFLADPENPNRFTSQIDYSSSEKAYGYVEVTASDQYSNSDLERVWLQHESVGIIDNRIYAYYEKAQASIDEEILVTVTSGEISGSFQFMLGVGLVMDEDAEYVAKSFNVGSPGGDVDFPDGIWNDVDPFTFILGPDRLIQPGANPDDTLGAANRFDFNISPLYGRDVVGVAGDLFNLRVKYSEPGLKTLTFQEVNGVNRTYYSNLEYGTNLFWDDPSNWHPGLQTSIVIE